MSENKLIIASAGSGKTTHLVKEALAKEGKILILTYTISNEDVIKRRITRMVGCMPANIRIQTWFSFLLQHGVKPYQDCMHDDLSMKVIRGMLLVNNQSGIKYKNKKGQPVLYSETGDFFKHYFTKDMKIYSDKISKFVVRCNKQSGGKVINRVAKIYDHILIDEVQDLAGYDLELLKLLFASSVTTLLVGDPRQVTYLTHIERKYKKYRNGKIKEFVETELSKSVECTVDSTTLSASHRCCQAICEYSSLLYLELPHTNKCTCCTCGEEIHQGVFVIEKKYADDYLRNFNVMQLRWDRKTVVHDTFPFMNFGEAKGETFNRVLIYPTNDMIIWMQNNEHCLSDGARAKLYVALTRARFSAGILVDCAEGIESDLLTIYEPESTS